MRPLRAKLRERLDEPPESDPAILICADKDLAEEISLSGREHEDNLVPLCNELNEIGNLSATEGSETTVRHAVRRIEVLVDALLDDFGQVRKWDIRARNRRARNTMEDLHRHYLMAVLA